EAGHPFLYDGRRCTPCLCGERQRAAACDVRRLAFAPGVSMAEPLLAAVARCIHERSNRLTARLARLWTFGPEHRRILFRNLGAGSAMCDRSGGFFGAWHVVGAARG